MLKPKDPTKAISGTKALLLDRETVRRDGRYLSVALCFMNVLTATSPEQKTIVSMVMGMTDILAKEGVLIYGHDGRD